MQLALFKLKIGGDTDNLPDFFKLSKRGDLKIIGLIVSFEANEGNGCKKF